MSESPENIAKAIMESFAKTNALVAENCLLRETVRKLHEQLKRSKRGIAAMEKVKLGTKV